MAGQAAASRMSSSRMSMDGLGHQRLGQQAAKGGFKAAGELAVFVCKMQHIEWLSGCITALRSARSPGHDGSTRHNTYQSTCDDPLRSTSADDASYSTRCNSLTTVLHAYGWSDTGHGLGGQSRTPAFRLDSRQCPAATSSSTQSVMLEFVRAGC